jgi:hypothetical protein
MAGKCPPLMREAHYLIDSQEKIFPHYHLIDKNMASLSTPSRQPPVALRDRPAHSQPETITRADI